MMCTSIKQHSLFQSLLLHLFPGMLISFTFVWLGPWLKHNHLPLLLAILIPILIVLIPVELGWLYYQGFRQNGRLSLEGIVVNRDPLPLKDYLKIVSLLLLWSVLIFIRSYLKNGKLWLKSRMETSQWNLPTNNGTSSNR